MINIISYLVFLLSATGFYDYSLPDTQGGVINFSDYQGKKVLLVNTASNSPLAWQYEKLEELYEKYQDSLVVIAVPSNSFGDEQNNDSTNYSYVTVTYGVTYPLAGITQVAGDSTADVYQWLSSGAMNGAMDNTINNDFQKFLIDGSGNLIGVFAPSVDPMGSEMQNAITGVQ